MSLMGRTPRRCRKEKAAFNDRRCGEQNGERCCVSRPDRSEHGPDLGIAAFTIAAPTNSRCAYREEKSRFEEKPQSLLSAAPPPKEMAHPQNASDSPPRAGTEPNSCGGKNDFEGGS